MAVKKRGSQWYYDFKIRGARFRRAVPEARTKAQAERAETLAREAVYNRRYGVKVAPKLADFFAETYLPWAKTNKRSYANDRSRSKPIVAALGRLRLDEVTPFHVEKFKRERMTQPTRYGRLPSAVTVNHELKILSRAFTLAADQGLLDANPCGKVKRLREDADRNRYLTPEEERRLMGVLTGPLASLRPVVVLAVTTGMRRGEIYGLRWEQVDFGRGTITLLQTKSGRARVVPMSGRVRAELLALGPQTSGWVFPGSRSNQHRSEGHFRHPWGHCRRACREAGLDDLRFHDLRHTAATRLAESGADAFTIAAVLGHSSVQMTARYVHNTAPATKQAMEALAGYSEQTGHRSVTSVDDRDPRKGGKVMTG